MGGHSPSPVQRALKSSQASSYLTPSLSGSDDVRSSLDDSSSIETHSQSHLRPHASPSSPLRLSLLQLHHSTSVPDLGQSPPARKIGFTSATDLGGSPDSFQLPTSWSPLPCSPQLQLRSAFPDSDEEDDNRRTTRSRVPRIGTAKRRLMYNFASSVTRPHTGSDVASSKIRPSTAASRAVGSDSLGLNLYGGRNLTSAKSHKTIESGEKRPATAIGHSGSDSPTLNSVGERPRPALKTRNLLAQRDSILPPATVNSLETSIANFFGAPTAQPRSKTKTDSRSSPSNKLVSPEVYVISRSNFTERTASRPLPPIPPRGPNTAPVDLLPEPSEGLMHDTQVPSILGRAEMTGQLSKPQTVSSVESVSNRLLRYDPSRRPKKLPESSTSPVIHPKCRLASPLEAGSHPICPPGVKTRPGTAPHTTCHSTDPYGNKERIIESSPTIELKPSSAWTLRRAREQNAAARLPPRQPPPSYELPNTPSSSSCSEAYPDLELCSSSESTKSERKDGSPPTSPVESLCIDVQLSPHSASDNFQSATNPLVELHVRGRIFSTHFKTLCHGGANDSGLVSQIRRRICEAEQAAISRGDLELIAVPNRKVSRRSRRRGVVRPASPEEMRSDHHAVQVRSTNKCDVTEGCGWYANNFDDKAQFSIADALKSLVVTSSPPSQCDLSPMSPSVSPDDALSPLGQELDRVLEPLIAEQEHYLASRHTSSLPSDVTDEKFLSYYRMSAMSFHSDAMSTKQTFSLQPLRVSRIVVVLDRDPRTYPALLDTLRLGSLPESVTNYSYLSMDSDSDDGSSSTKQQAKTIPYTSVRRRVAELRVEAAWLGYNDIVAQCDQAVCPSLPPLHLDVDLGTALQLASV